MALQKRFTDPRKQFVDPYWTIISGVLSHGRGRAKLTLDRRECVEFGNVLPALSRGRLLRSNLLSFYLFERSRQDLRCKTVVGPFPDEIRECDLPAFEPSVGYRKHGEDVRLGWMERH
jgi:hypothetical protein